MPPHAAPPPPQQSVVLTDTSAPHGHALAVTLCRRGWRVFGCCRSAESVDTLVKAFGDVFTPLLLDTSVCPSDAAISRAVDSVHSVLGATRCLSALVCNGGRASLVPLALQSRADMRGVIEAGVTLPMLLTRALLPLLGTDLKRCGPPGRVVYVTSVLGVASMPFMAPSCAAQAGLEGLAHALRRELRPYGIKVALCADNQAASVPTKGWSTPAPEEALRNTAWAGPFARVSRELEASQKVVADATHAGEAASRLVALLEGGAKPPLRDALLTRPASGFEAVLLRGALLTHKMLDGAVARHLGWKGVKVARSTQQPPPPAPPSPPDDGGPPPCPPSPGGDAPTPLPTPGAGGGGRVSGGVQLARAPA